MLWRIEGTEMHVMSSVHVSRKALAFSTVAQGVINAAWRLTLEANIAATPNPMYEKLKRPRQLSDLVAPPLLRDVTERWKEWNLNIDELQSLTPGAVYRNLMRAALAMWGYGAHEGCERVVLGMRKWQRPTNFLESINDSISPFVQLSIEEATYLLNRVVNETEDARMEVEELIDILDRQDLESLEAFGHKVNAATPKLYRLLLAKRNQLWLGRLLRLIRADKRELVLVGALHMVGTESILALLAQSGYPATRLE